MHIVRGFGGSLTRKSYTDASHAHVYKRTRDICEMPVIIAGILQGEISEYILSETLYYLHTRNMWRALPNSKISSLLVLTVNYSVVGRSRHHNRFDTSARSPGPLSSGIPRPSLSEFLLAPCVLPIGLLSAIISRLQIYRERECVIT